MIDQSGSQSSPHAEDADVVEGALSSRVPYYAIESLLADRPCGDFFVICTRGRSLTLLIWLIGNQLLKGAQQRMICERFLAVRAGLTQTVDSLCKRSENVSSTESAHQRIDP